MRTRIVVQVTNVTRVAHIEPIPEAHTVMFCASMFVMVSADVTGERVKTMETLLSHASRPYAARLHASKVPCEYANILLYFQYLDIS
jgi:hypothetical protein